MSYESVIQQMKDVFAEIPFGIEHTLRVLKNAEAIMIGENLNETEKQVIILSAILHDIGAVKAMEKYNSIDGKYQEIEGPEVARRILGAHGCETDIIDRVCFIIGNHHTPTKINGIDFQILWEADLLENLIGSTTPTNQIKDIIDSSFKTRIGHKLANNMLL